MPYSPAQLLDGIEELFAIPSVCLRVNQMAEDTRYSALDIAHEIGKDPHLTAQVLRVANSAYYNFPARIDTLTRAIMIIGVQDLRNLVLAMGFVSASEKKPSRHFDFRAFWQHSLFVGLLAKRLGSMTPVRVLHRERLFVAGVLHDIGQLVMSYKIPELMDIMQQRAQLLVESFDMTQRVIFDMDYAQVGAELLKRWNLPGELQNVVRYQVTPQNASAQQLDAAILHIANHYSSATGLPSIGLETVENVNPFVWKITGLSHDDVMLAVDEARKEYDVSVSHFMPAQKVAKRA